MIIEMFIVFRFLKSPGFMRVCAGCANRNEATSNIDPENEQLIQHAMEELTRDKTIIMIAHRLKTVRNADQIIVMNQGRIAQRGTHEQLMKQGGIYASLINVRTEALGWKLS